MKIWGERIGPAKYFSAMATIWCLIPYVWQFPQFWPVSISITLIALFSYRRFLGRHEPQLRDWSNAFPSRIQSQFLVFTAALLVGHTLLVVAL